MIHRKLSTNPDQHYGVSINTYGEKVLLQLGDQMEQVRVQLTPKEVDELISELLEKKKKISGL